MGNFFGPLEQKVQTPGDVAVELRRLSDDVRACPSVTDARLKVIRFLMRPDVRETLGDTRIKWMRHDLQKATDVESVNVFLSNTTRCLEKDDTMMSMDLPGSAEMDMGGLRSHGPIVGKQKKQKGKEAVRQTAKDIVKNMPPEVKLRVKEGVEDPLAEKWTSMTVRQRFAAAQKAGFSPAEARELAKLAWEGLHPSIKADLEWVLKAPPEHLPKERFLAPMVPMGAASAGGAGYWGPSDEAFPGQLPMTGVVEGATEADPEEIPEKEPKYYEILDSLEGAIQSLADSHAAEAWSTPTDEMIDQFGDDVYVMASFGDWVAVNGDLVGPDQPTPKPPEGYELTDYGGHIPEEEEEVEVEAAVRSVAQKMGIPQERVQKVADAEGYKELAYVSVSGEAEVWAKPRGKRPEKTESGERSHLPPFLSPSKKKAINKRLADISRQYWNSIWEATDAIHKALRENGIEPDDYIITGEPQGMLTIPIFMAGEEIANSMLVLSWHRFPETGRYEINAYLS